MNFVNYGQFTRRYADGSLVVAHNVRRWQYRGQPLGKDNTYPHQINALFEFIKNAHNQALHNAFIAARRAGKSDSVKRAFDGLTMRLESVVAHDEDYTWYAYAKQCAAARRRALKRRGLLAPKLSYPMPPVDLRTLLNFVDTGCGYFDYPLNVLIASFRYHWGH